MNLDTILFIKNANGRRRNTVVQGKPDPHKKSAVFLNGYAVSPVFDGICRAL